MAKKFMFVCFGILALAGAYALGASSVTAQVSGIDVIATYITGGSDPATVVLATNGDMYARPGYINGGGTSGQPRWSGGSGWTFMGNCYSGAVSSQDNSLGGVKGLFR